MFWKKKPTGPSTSKDYPPVPKIPIAPNTPMPKAKNMSIIIGFESDDCSISLKRDNNTNEIILATYGSWGNIVELKGDNSLRSLAKKILEVTKEENDSSNPETTTT